jgi:hypothetical protein
MSRARRPGLRRQLLLLVAIAVFCALSLPEASTSTAGPLAIAGHGGVQRGNQCHRSKIDVPSCGVLWGMFRPKTPTRHKYRWSHHYHAVEKRTGRRFDLVKNYVPWVAHATFPPASDNHLARKGRTLYFSWSPVNYRTGKKISYAGIASGYWDRSVILPEARRLKHFHHRIFIDFSHEFDAKWQAPNGTPKQFAAAYRHIEDVMTQAGVHNVIWSWVTTGYTGNLAKIRAGFPGRAYVDWIGYDPYNMASCLGAPWRSSYYTFHQFYAWVQHQPVMRGKPLMIAEYGSVHGPKVRHWYASIPRDLRRMPRIKALMQFSAPTRSGCDVGVPDSAAALAGFAHAGNATRVIGRRM